MHIADACASLWIDGALVRPEDIFGRRDQDHQRVMTAQPAGRESAAVDLGLDRIRGGEGEGKDEGEQNTAQKDPSKRGSS